MVITGKTKLVGIFGYPVEHTLSPLMHNAAFQALGMDYVYVPFRVEPVTLGEAVKSIRALGLTGVNVTIPHKEMVMPYLDTISQEAKLIGAVNTVVNKDGILHGYNTDGIGFIRSLQEKRIDIKGKNVMLIGAGGAARAVAVQLALEGAGQVCITVREKDLADALSIVHIINTGTESKGEAIPLAGAPDFVWPKDDLVIVNCTPLGMHPDIQSAPPVNLQAVSEDTVVCDLVYNPLETTFLKRAKELGLPTVSGIGMLLYQGAAAFEIWTGRTAPVEIMAEALESHFS